MSTGKTDVLSGLKELYSQVYLITRQLEEEFTHDSLMSVVSERNELLNEIVKQRTGVNSEAVRKNDTRDDLFEIEKLIDGIKKIDLAIQQKIKIKMETITQELGGLYTSSRAAMAYAQHQKN
jgi:hypothetical protein